MMAAKLDELSVAIGGLRADVNNLSKVVAQNQEASTEEHRKVHDIVEAMSDAIRTLTRDIAEIKPLSHQYREESAQARGAAKFIKAMYVTGGGIVGAVSARLMEVIFVKPHP